MRMAGSGGFSVRIACSCGGLLSLEAGTATAALAQIVPFLQRHRCCDDYDEGPLCFSCGERMDSEDPHYTCPAGAEET